MLAWYSPRGYIVQWYVQSHRKDKDNYLTLVNVIFLKLIFNSNACVYVCVCVSVIYTLTAHRIRMQPNILGKCLSKSPIFQLSYSLDLAV